MDSKSNPLLKLTNTRNIIRKKFKIACMNRLECERDANQAMKPIASTTTKTKNFPLAIAPIARINSQQSRIIETNDPNDLCARLRALLASNKSYDNAQCIEEIKAIIAKLYDLNILLK